MVASEPMTPPVTPILADPTSVAETLVGNEDERSTETLAGAPDGSPQPQPADVLARGAMLGRYIVLDTLGRGAMGIVHAAYDPELDRKVALKLLLPGRDRGGSARLRLQREAQAIARVSHPNVVAVHDVGTMGEQVFIAMELVEGMDLARWLAAEPRSQEEILELLLQAGAGLAAAHAAELVHRDFKPENVLVGRDGRARVVDFGLVRKDDAASSMSVEELPETVSQRQMSLQGSLRLTDAGALVGTPAYMSPEQFAGSSGDARSDQFAFCVTLYEALYGERPFAGESLPELMYAVYHGEVRAPSSQRAVPGRLRQVLLRGLAVDPPARYPSMDALMAAVRKAVVPRRTWWAIAGVVTLVALGGSGGLVAYGVHETGCEHASAERMAQVWSPSRSEALRERFEQTGLSYAADTWQRVHGHLDEHTREWVAQAIVVCEANRGLEPAVAVEDPRQRCLDERLGEIDDLLSIFAQGQAGTVTQAIPLVHGLGTLEACETGDPNAMPPTPSDPVLREQVRALRAELRRLELASAAGLGAHEPEALEALVERARALGYAPLWVEVQDVQSGTASDQGNYDSAVEQYNRAFETALASRHDVWAFRVAASLSFLHGVERREPAEGLAWARRAEALCQRLGNDRKQRLQLLNNWAAIYALTGDEEHTRALYDEALSIARELDDPFALALLLNNIGGFHAERRRLREARVYFEESVARHEALMGPGHPATLRTQANLGVLTMMEGREVEGRQLLEAVLPRQEAALGPNHPEVAVTLEGLSAAATRGGELEAAEGMRRRVLEIRLRAYGPRSQPVLAAKNNLVALQIVAGRNDEAHALALEMLHELDAMEGEDPRVRVHALGNIALAALELDRPEEALGRAEEGLALCRTIACLELDELSLSSSVANAKLALGDRTGARATFEAILQRPRNPAHAWIPLQARFGWARATLPDDREAAIAMARRALAEAEPGDTESQRTVRRIETWLREHG